VWFERDLRVRDHAPLVAAMRFERALGLVVIEPDWLDSPDNPCGASSPSRTSSMRCVEAIFSQPTVDRRNDRVLARTQNLNAKRCLDYRRSVNTGKTICTAWSTSNFIV
jgi:hypothetical protein